MKNSSCSPELTRARLDAQAGQYLLPVTAGLGLLPATAALPGYSSGLRPGAFVRVDIVTDTHTDALVVVQGRDHPALLSDSVDTEAVHWIAGEAPALTDETTREARDRAAARLDLSAERPDGG